MTFGRTVKFCLVFGLITPLALFNMVPLFVLFVEGFDPFLKSLVYASGLFDLDVVLFDQRYSTIADIAMGLFEFALPFDFSGIRMRESDVAIVLILGLLAPVLSVAISRIALSATFGLGPEPDDAIQKRGMGGRAWANRAFFRSLLFIPLIMGVLYSWAALQSTQNPSYWLGVSHKSVSQQMLAQISPVPEISFAIVGGLILLSFLVFVARLQNFPIAILITLFTLAGSWTTTTAVQNLLINIPVEFPIHVNGIEQSLPFAFFVVPAFLAFVVACVLSGLVAKTFLLPFPGSGQTMNGKIQVTNQDRTIETKQKGSSTQQTSRKSPHWIRGR